MTRPVAPAARAGLVVLVLLGGATWAPGQPVEAKAHDEAVPAAISAALSSLIAPGGVRAAIGPVVVDFWWVKALPVAAAPPAWDTVEEGTLVGAVRLTADFRDVRGRVIRAGVYTMRYGVQPDNGDHLGSSPFRDFLLLVPARVDISPAPLGHKGSIDLSRQTIGGSHPAVWSIDPPLSRAPVLSAHTTELGHHAVVVEVQVAFNGKPVGPLRFGVVLAGRIDA